MVTTCLSPAFVQTGAIPNFTATNPTLRLPERRSRAKDGQRASQQVKSLTLNRALANHDTHPLSTHVAARAHLWVGWALQLFAFCIPLLCFSSCTPGYPQWDVPQTMLSSLQSWHNPPKGQGCKTFWGKKQVQLFTRKAITQVQMCTSNGQTHSQMYLLSKHVQDTPL